jgi:hypothetical protein
MLELGSGEETADDAGGTWGNDGEGAGDVVNGPLNGWPGVKGGVRSFEGAKEAILGLLFSFLSSSVPLLFLSRTLGYARDEVSGRF